METASFSGIIRAILIFFAFYYVVKFLARLFLPYLAKKAIEKASEKLAQQQQKKQQENQQTNQNKTSEKPTDKKVVGEYVDFEEID